MGSTDTKTLKTYKLYLYKFSFWVNYTQYRIRLSLSTIDIVVFFFIAIL